MCLPSVGRVCPGQYLAEASLFLAVTMSLATFNISKAHDEDGNTIEPEIEWVPAAIWYDEIFALLSDSLVLMTQICTYCSHPKPFKCKIEPRSAQAAELVRNAIAEHECH